MKRVIIAFASLCTLGICLQCLTTAAYGGGKQNLKSVVVQTNTPGATQVGHAHISGSFLAGRVESTTGFMGGTSSDVLTLAVNNSYDTVPFFGTAITGSALGATTNGVGVWGQSSGPVGSGVRGSGHYGGRFLGDSNSTTGYGVYSQGYEGGYFESAGGGYIGVHGVSTNGSGVGGYFEARNGAVGTSTADTGIGVTGWATHTTGANIAVRGESLSPAGVGIFGQNITTGTSMLAALPPAAGRFKAGGFAVAVHGIATGTQQNCGGRFEANGPLAYACWGKATYTGASPGGYGGFFETAQGTAVRGEGTDGGGYFTATAFSGRAIEGYASGAGSPYAGFFTATPSSGTGVLASGYVGVKGSSTTTSGGYGVWGVSTATNGIGGLFSASSASGTGVHGVGNIGVNGITSGSTGTFGGYFESGGSSASGVYGGATHATGATYGGRFQNVSTNGIGVYGIASATSGGTAGGYFQSDSVTGKGLVAWNSATTGQTLGGHFENYSSAGIGVFGNALASSGTTFGGDFQSVSPAGRGVAGIVTASTGVAYGVIGQDVPANGGFAVYAIGDVGASGTKPFRIDHPADPTNKYLMHYATESPFPQNFYSGNVVTDMKGYAWVSLPDYFEEINTDYKYQLTIVDDDDADSFVMAKISKKIRSNRFQIRTSAPGVEVSWRVEANRNDPYVKLKKPKDVVEKKGVEKGTYQVPELYGAPKEMGMMYRPNR